ncbi:MAG: hypothetical protein KBT09_03315 [Bacteroidales bacterium]|nr:hypothetical protein [Candidatus Sodaliphilus fimicaballi]
MKIYISLLLTLTLWSQCVAAEHYNTDSVLKVLDNVIDSTSYYEDMMHAKLSKHLIAYESTADVAVKYHEAHRLVIYYRKFRVDSAVYFARQQVKYGNIIGNGDTIALAKMSEADVLKRLGRFRDAVNILNSIPHTDFVKTNTYYYDIYLSSLNSMVNNCIGDEERNQIKALRKCYRDTVIMLNHHNGSVKLMCQAETLKENGKYDEALELLMQCKKKYYNDIINNAVFWAVLGEVYRFMGNTEGAKYCYGMSAIIDKRQCNKTYTSLQNLAALLFDEGDTDHAYRYISLSMSDIREANAFSRLALVGEYLPIITTAYEKKQQAVASRRTSFIIISSLAAIVMATLLVLLVRRTKKLTDLRLKLADNNNQLKTLNSALNNMNKALEESNIIKEVYIGQLFNLCSNYIGQHENYRTSLMTKVKSGKIKDVEKMLNQSTSNSQLKELFKNFDRVFLEIFPNFIDNFNSLLRPEEQLQPKSGELLSPELRIYALVRLGINDSTKIAEFLHYSVQTVYNYRQKTRNKAIVSRDEFIERVKSI